MISKQIVMISATQVFPYGFILCGENILMENVYFNRMSELIGTLTDAYRWIFLINKGK